MELIESKPVATPTHGRRRRVTLSRVARSPNGTVTVLEEHAYNFKPTPPGEVKGSQAAKNRKRACREARQNARDMFDPGKMEEKRKKRRKGELPPACSTQPRLSNSLVLCAQKQCKMSMISWRCRSSRWSQLSTGGPSTWRF